ncbi:MAG: gamma-glutamyl-gamma-aminobutyrate hydrolase family protein [Phycisphaerales bacterium]|nr:gamma-glutamyl-gamma-aminobutyrate hydrolase family protein [Phycisphaerales bacterium]
MPRNQPLIAITSDLMVRNERPTAFSTMTYTRSVLAAGGVPVILPPTPDHTAQLIDHFDAFILTGGDDPVTEPFGTPTHPESIRVLPDRQNFETQLLNDLKSHPDIPVLGICLGMQMMGLIAGGTLNQHLPDTHTSHADHWEHTHEIRSIDESIIPAGTTYSKHRQAMQTPGSLRTLATAHDDVIEAIDDPDRRFYLGVQWHPERTENAPLGQHIIDKLVQAARS